MTITIEETILTPVIAINDTIINPLLTVQDVVTEINLTINEQVTSFIVEVSDIAIPGQQGIRGFSAYQIALNNGFIGTEPQWLDSLKDKPVTKIAAESIPSHTPVAIVNNQAYKLDVSNPLHQFAFAGFSLNGTSAGFECIIKQSGEVYLGGWGLIPNQHYLAGINGTLITNNLSATNFTKVIGYATTSDSLQIVTSQTINK